MHCMMGICSPPHKGLFVVCWEMALNILGQKIMAEQKKNCPRCLLLWTWFCYFALVFYLSFFCYHLGFYLVKTRRTHLAIHIIKNYRQSTCGIIQFCMFFTRLSIIVKKERSHPNIQWKEESLSFRIYRTIWQRGTVK